MAFSQTTRKVSNGHSMMPWIVKNTQKYECFEETVAVLTEFQRNFFKFAGEVY